MSENHNQFPVRLAVYSSLGCVGAAVAYGGALLLLDKLGFSTVERMGARGDAFAFLNTIFSGIGMVFVALTLWTTHRDLAEQRIAERRSERMRIISQLLEANGELQRLRAEPGITDFTSVGIALNKMRTNLLKELVIEAERMEVTASDPIKEFLDKASK